MAARYRMPWDTGDQNPWETPEDDAASRAHLPSWLQGGGGGGGGMSGVMGNVSGALGGGMAAGGANALYGANTRTPYTGGRSGGGGATGLPNLNAAAMSGIMGGQQAAAGMFDQLMGGGQTYRSSGGMGGNMISLPQAAWLQDEQAAGGAGGAGGDYGQSDLEAEWEKQLPWLQGTASKIAETGVRRTMGNAQRAETSQLARSGMLGSGVAADVERRRKENLALRLSSARDMAKMEMTLPYLGMKERGVDRAYQQRSRYSMAANGGAGVNQGYTATLRSGGTNLPGRRNF